MPQAWHFNSLYFSETLRKHICEHFLKFLLLPFTQKVVKADDRVIYFVLFTLRLTEKSSCCSRGFKSPPLSCDSANSQSNPGLKPGFLLVLSCRGWISPRQANEQKLILFMYVVRRKLAPHSPHLFLQNVSSLLHQSLRVPNGKK